MYTFFYLFIINYCNLLLMNAARNVRGDIHILTYIYIHIYLNIWCGKIACKYIYSSENVNFQSSNCSSQAIFSYLQVHSNYKYYCRYPFDCNKTWYTWPLVLSRDSYLDGQNRANAPPKKYCWAKTSIVLELSHKLSYKNWFEFCTKNHCVEYSCLNLVDNNIWISLKYSLKMVYIGLS